MVLRPDLRKLKRHRARRNLQDVPQRLGITNGARLFTKSASSPRSGRFFASKGELDAVDTLRIALIRIFKCRRPAIPTQAPNEQEDNSRRQLRTQPPPSRRQLNRTNLPITTTSPKCSNHATDFSTTTANLLRLPLESRPSGTAAPKFGQKRLLDFIRRRPTVRMVEQRGCRASSRISSRISSGVASRSPKFSHSTFELL